MTTTVYLNGEWLASEHAKVSVFDRGFLFADGIYEVIPVYQKHPFLAELHLKRLARSLTEIGIAAPSTEFWLELIEQLIERNTESDCLVYIQVTFGADTVRSHLPDKELQPTLFASVSPLQVHWDIPKPVKVTLHE